MKPPLLVKLHCPTISSELRHKVTYHSLILPRPDPQDSQGCYRRPTTEGHRHPPRIGTLAVTGYIQFLPLDGTWNNSFTNIFCL